MGQVMKVLHVLRKLGFYPISDKELVKIFFFLTKQRHHQISVLKTTPRAKGEAQRYHHHQPVHELLTHTSYLPG